MWFLVLSLSLLSNVVFASVSLAEEIPSPPPVGKIARPFSDADEVGFIAVTGEDSVSPEDDFLDELAGLRDQLIDNLPSGVKLIIYVRSQERGQSLKKLYGVRQNGDRIRYLVTPGAPLPKVLPKVGHPKGVYEGWGRDSLPYPVVLKPGPSVKNKFALIDSLPQSRFQPDAVFGAALGLPLISNQVVFRGGNVMPDLKGNCFLENAIEVPQLLAENRTFLADFLGCKTVHVFTPDGGIGDIDERLKFINNNVALTDSPLFKQELIGKGYIVREIPRAQNEFESYMNSIIANGTIFVPTFGSPTDRKVLAAYAGLGLKVVPVKSKILSNKFHGSLHCLTMNYPVGAFMDVQAKSESVKNISP